MEIYLDNAATTQVCREAADAAYNAMCETYGNPGSTHTKGREAKKLLDTARTQVASGLGCKPEEIFFTSCGSESDNWAILEGVELQKRKGKHIITSVTEHDAVRQPMDKLERLGYEVTWLKPDATGSIAPESVAEALREDTILVSLMTVNNETGSITDIAKISQILKEKQSGALLHTDAVQAYLKIPFTAKSIGADMISISGHKIHAPKGIGALYIRSGVRLPAHILGGGQESGLRSGTEPLPQIAAFGTAAEIALSVRDTAGKRMAMLRQKCIDLLLRDGTAQVLGGGAPHILSISLPGYRSEVLMNYLESKGIFVSKSSACKRGRRSHVLEAMGIPDKVIDGALRISFSRFTTEEECDALCEALHQARKDIRVSR